jgi:hypothetical protein
MDITDPTDVAAVIGVLLGLFSWLVRRWIKDNIETMVVPHPENDETSVATCAREARDAAQNAGDAALAAALDAKSAALSAASAGQSAESAVNSLLDRK